MRVIVHLYFIDIYCADIWLFVIFSCINLQKFSKIVQAKYPVSVSDFLCDNNATDFCQTCNFFQKKISSDYVDGLIQTIRLVSRHKLLYSVVISSELFIFSVIMIHISPPTSSLFLSYFRALHFLHFNCNFLKTRFSSQRTSSSMIHS